MVAGQYTWNTQRYPELREKLHKTRVHIGKLVKDTSAKLKQASETDDRVEVSASKKITDAKLAKDFQAVLKEFQKAQRLAAERETAYTPFVPQAVLPSSQRDRCYGKESRTAGSPCGIKDRRFYFGQRDCL
ncbi:hypothetical protein K7X08_020927 [Anisodus acutangulus]|uniref:Syntaxin N-terminal domain-containing protein n=1 Tax=Anisodus acutangulus TaxID=402998 RepID=A0A9Q1MTE3_9SOLA|nr:hypothetical protein K7X08_020927 [Anisodus acutangulus]